MLIHRFLLFPEYLFIIFMLPFKDLLIFIPNRKIFVFLCSRIVTTGTFICVQSLCLSNSPTIWIRAFVASKSQRKCTILSQFYSNFYRKSTGKRLKIAMGSFTSFSNVSHHHTFKPSVKEGLNSNLI